MLTSGTPSPGCGNKMQLILGGNMANVWLKCVLSVAIAGANTGLTQFDQAAQHTPDKSTQISAKLFCCPIQVASNARLHIVKQSARPLNFDRVFCQSGISPAATYPLAEYRFISNSPTPRSVRVELQI